jgi:hypothetical protein
MSVINRIKKIARDINTPFLEQTASQAMVNQHLVVKHKSLSIPTEDDEMFQATNIEKGKGHVGRSLDKTEPTSSDADVSPENLPSVTVADDKKATSQVASMFHALATKRGILKAKIATGENTTDAAKSLMSVHARMANVKGLGDTLKRFEGKE